MRSYESLFLQPMWRAVLQQTKAECSNGRPQKLVFEKLATGEAGDGSKLVKRKGAEVKTSKANTKPPKVTSKVAATTPKADANSAKAEAVVASKADGETPKPDAKPAKTEAKSSKKRARSMISVGVEAQLPAQEGPSTANRPAVETTEGRTSTLQCLVKGADEVLECNICHKKMRYLSIL